MPRLPTAEPILAAAERWRDRCLLADGSILSDGAVWTLENFKQLDECFVQHRDAGEGTFWTKLKTQLAPASPAAIQLAAEILWVMYLQVRTGSIAEKTKRFQLQRVWEWSGAPFPEDEGMLGDVLGEGISNPGTAFHTHRWREFSFMITAFEDWKALALGDQARLIGDPWAFAEWLEDREEAPGRQMRHILLFLLFPDHFDPIATTTHKRQIVRAFAEEAGEPAPAIDYSDRVAVDREVLKVRERYAAKIDDPTFNFYRSPATDVWGGPGPGGSKPPPPRPPLKGDAAAWLHKQFGTARYWLLTAGTGGRMWNEFQERGIAAVGWSYLKDLADYETREEIMAAITAEDGRENPFVDALALWQFSREISEGDIIIAKRGWTELLGWGVVGGPYEYDPESGEYPNLRAVEWKTHGSWDVPEDQRAAVKTLTEFTPGAHAEWLRSAFQAMAGEPHPWPPPAESPDGYPLSRAMQGLFIGESDFTEIIDTLSRRKNVILQGPPGVGKTFIAKRIAWRLIGRKDPSRVQMIQFHQSYAYEDFIQGWRPTESGGFTLRNGVFHEFCRRAAETPELAAVFIIDEINRGNLSRIFGELMMLIEADKRGEAHAVPLTYSQDGETFSVPEHVHILGLMNTADRSLAMVDYALRRRFGFVDLRPAFGTDGFSDYLLNVAEMDEDLVRRIEARMAALNETITQDTKNLGPGFAVGHSYFVPSDDDDTLDENWYRGIVRTQIAPLLREYWFDQPSRVEEEVDRLLA